ncbi:MAG: hypothetical protein EX330_01455 [Candidatus Brocadia sp. BROELEC01]|nr:hypothetical protein [Candidatus Brocadia sapporoensis]QQR65633.1 MAG: hypothetical protein IPI25_08585 [Candidatus Brocadia sp.]RZV59866.1 MAG: hypothetical protein EX330_01455 [Candidatus Brocadia sp. BROELEC01]
MGCTGPGIVWIAPAQGSGELIWCPYFVVKYGLTSLFLLTPACLLQYTTIIEIGRYPSLRIGAFSIVSSG